MDCFLPVLVKVTFIGRAVWESVNACAMVHVVFEFSFILSSRGMLQGPSAMHLVEGRRESINNALSDRQT